MKKITLLVISLLAIQTIFATSWRINNKVGIDANFTSLQQANDTSAVHNGDTIYCDNGAFVGSATISKQLFIIGPGYFLTQVDTAYANPSSSSVNEITFDNGSDGSTITGMRITGFIMFKYCNSITVERCKVKLIKDYSTFGTSEGNNFIVRQCYIYDMIYLNYTKSIDIYNNIILGYIYVNTFLPDRYTPYVIYNASLDNDDDKLEEYTIGLRKGFSDYISVLVEYKKTDWAQTETLNDYKELRYASEEEKINMNVYSIQMIIRY